MIFTKDTFIRTLTAIREQYDYDNKRAKILAEIYGADVSLSDNSRLTNQLFNLLQSQFPPEGDICMIHTFCYDMDFGRSVGYSEEKLWYQLINHFNVVYEVVSNETKIEQLVKVFSKQNEVIIFCNEDDISTVFNELPTARENSYGEFEKEIDVNNNFCSVFKDGTTFHFAPKKQFFKLVGKKIGQKLGKKE